MTNWVGREGRLPSPSVTISVGVAVPSPLASHFNATFVLNDLVSLPMTRNVSSLDHIPWTTITAVATPIFTAPVH